MRRKKLVAAGLATVLACTTALAGCGSSGGSGGGTQNASTKGSGSDDEVVIWDYFETDAQKEMPVDMCRI